MRAPFLIALAVLALASCRRPEQSGLNAAPAAADAAAVVAVAPAAPPAGEGAADAGPPPPSKGRWLDGTSYRFRLDDTRTCSPAAVGGAGRIGALVSVTSNIHELLVVPRDFKLESGGVILDSAFLSKAPEGCAPLLAPKSLRPGKTATGIVVFELPPGFNPDRRPVKISYQPTRWGGARRVEALLPESS